MKLKIILPLMVFLIGIATNLYAATPSCYPPEPEATKPQMVCNDAGCAVIWYCDVGHSWVQWHFKGSMLESKAFVAASKFGDLINLSHAAKDALWNTIPADTGQDAAVETAVTAVGWIEQPPPSGLVTTDVAVYKQSQAIDGFTWKKFGTVPLGTPCYSVASDGTKVYKKVDGYYLIDRNLVTKSVKFDPLPNAAYGVCQ